MKSLILKKFESDNTNNKFSREGSLNLNMDAEIFVPSKYFENRRLKRSKRFRSAFTTDQINCLENQFKNFPYIGSANRRELANVLNISERAIKIWFQNRRMKEKREVNNSKELLSENKNNVYEQLSNEELNSHNINLIDSCGNNGMLLLNRHSSNDLSKSNIETGKAYHGSDEISNFISHPNVKTVNSINTPDEKGNAPMDMTLGNRNSSICKSYLLQKSKYNSRKASTISHRNVHIQQVKSENKESKGKVKSFLTSCEREDEAAEDLSLSSTVGDKKELNHFYPAYPYNDQRLVPLITQKYYVSQPVTAPQDIHSGNVVWNPVSIIPILPEIGPAATMTIGHNSSGIALNNHDVSKGTCNCHGPQHLFNASLPCVARTQSQYFLAIPFSNTSNI